MITHNMLAGAIFRDDLLDAWCGGFCNSGLSCRKCCDKMVTEYEDSIRKEAVRKFAEWLIDSKYHAICNQGLLYGESYAPSWDFPCASVDEVLAEYEKEQKNE